MLFSSNVKNFSIFVIMVAALSTPSTANKQQTPTRRPPLEKDTNGVVSRRPRARQVSSRYLSPAPSSSTSVSTTTTGTSSSCSSSSGRRYGSPFWSGGGGSRESLGGPGVKRAQSVDRRRTVSTVRALAGTGIVTGAGVVESRGGNVGEVSNASRILIASSRSLSVSFQGEAFSLPISKAKTTTTGSGVGNLRKGTPERRRVTPVKGRGDQVENCKSVDQHRWPGKSREAGLGAKVGIDSGPVSLTRSVDCGDGLRRSGGVVGGSGKGSRRSQLVRDESRRASFDGMLSLDLGNVDSCRAVNRNLDRTLGNETSVSCDLANSDSDSVSSGSTSGVQECTGGKQKSLPKPIVVSSRFWQETNSRMRRLQDSGSTLSNSPCSKAALAAKVKRFSSDNMSSSPRTMASPSKGSARPASPSKLWASTAPSPSRGSPSPSRVRSYITGSLNGNYMEQPSILSFSVDIRRGKLGEDRIINAHMLRLLHNRYMQWRFVNANADAICTVQRLNAESDIWNAWVTTSELQHSVTLKRMKLLLLRQKLKLASILKGHMAFLEDWDLLEKDHSSSLSGATEALKACTLRLPLLGKAVADIQKLKEAVGSAVDVMQAMASSICSLSSKAKEMNAVMVELVNITAKEQSFLDQCIKFLSIVAAMQVRDRSLRTHLIQQKHVPTRASLTTHGCN